MQVTKTDGSVVVSSKDIAITGGDHFEHVNLAVPTPVPPKPAPPKPAPPKPAPPRSGGSGPQMTQSVPAASQQTPKPATPPQVTIANASNTGPGTNMPRSSHPSTRPSTAAPTSGKTSQPSLTTPSNVQGNSVAGLSQLNSLIDTMFASLPQGLL